MQSIKTILVTGSHGYIGSLLTPLLAQAGFRVIGLDTGYFDDPKCVFKHHNTGEDRFIKKDIRAITAQDLKSVDAVCHLAALSNDPLGAVDPKLTQDINLKASVKLAGLAKKCGAQKFLFSSSCSVYGALGDKPITEESAVDPKTAYAVSKVEFEKILLGLADKNFCPIILRNATAYGSAPKLRLDLVLNNFAANAFTGGEIKILSDGTPWRPMIHAEDIARLFVALLKAPAKKVHNQIINCGQNKENFQVRDIATTVQKSQKNIQVSYASQPDKDSRTYKVSFDKLHRILPDFKFKWTLKKAAEELKNDFQKLGLTQDVLVSRNFVRLAQLQHLTQNKVIDHKFFWKK